MKTFSSYPCQRCGRMISNAGFAYSRHHSACEKKPALTPAEKLEGIAKDCEKRGDYSTAKRIRAVIIEQARGSAHD